MSFDITSTSPSISELTDPYIQKKKNFVHSLATTEPSFVTIDSALLEYFKLGGLHSPDASIGNTEHLRIIYNAFGGSKVDGVALNSALDQLEDLGNELYTYGLKELEKVHVKKMLQKMRSRVWQLQGSRPVTSRISRNRKR